MRYKRFSFLVIGIIALCFFSILHACKKNKAQEILINGRIFDPNSNKAVSNATVRLQVTSFSGSIYTSGYSDLIVVTTDESGNFVMDFLSQQTDNYKISITAPNYFMETYIEDAEKINNTSTHSLQYNLYPEAYIKLFVRNTNPFDSLDMISYSYNSAMPACNDCCNNTVFKGYGEQYTDTILCRLYGNQDVELQWNVTKDNQTTIQTQQIFCPASDTTEYTILY
jgi:hypothetical protein